jgi:hypothetical protein
MPITSPSDLVNLQHWVDLEDSSTIDAPGGLTYTLVEKSVNVRSYAFQTNIAAQIVTSPLGNYRFLRIVGAGGQIRCDGLAPIFGSPFSLYVVGGLHATASSGGAALVGVGRSSSGTPLVTIGAALSKYIGLMRNDANTLRQITSTSDAENTPAVYCLIYDGANLTFYRNNVSLGSGSFSGATTLDQFGIGVSPRNGNLQIADCIIAAIVAYSTAHSTADRTDVYDYLANRHGVGNSLSGEVSLSNFPAASVPKLARLTDNGTTIRCTYDSSRRLYVPNSGHTGEYFVDWYNGNDSNSGLIGSPLKTMDAALAKPDVRTVRPVAGLHPASWNGTYTRPNRSVVIAALSSKAYFCNAEDNTSWTKTAGQNFVYEVARTAATIRVVDLTSLNPTTGQPLSYASRTSIALVDANPGSYFDDGSSRVYVSCFDSRSADRNIVVQKGTNACRIPFTAPNRFFSVNDCVFIGHDFTGQSWDISASYVYFDGTESHWTSDWSFSNVDEIYYVNCRLTRLTGDGYDYRGDTIGVEVNCLADDTDADDTNNGSTGHDSAVILRVGGDYTRAYRNIHDIDSTISFTADCDVNDARTGGAESDCGFVAGLNDGGTDAVKMRVYKCRMSGNATDLTSNKGCAIVCDGMRPSLLSQVMNDTGTITFINEPLAAFPPSLSPMAL